MKSNKILFALRTLPKRPYSTGGHHSNIHVTVKATDIKGNNGKCEAFVDGINHSGSTQIPLSLSTQSPFSRHPSMVQGQDGCSDPKDPTPFDYLLVSMASSTASSLVKYVRDQGWSESKVTDIKVKSQLSYNNNNNNDSETSPFTITQEIEINNPKTLNHGISHEQKMALLQWVKCHCPVSKLLDLRKISFNMRFAEQQSDSHNHHNHRNHNDIRNGHKLHHKTN